MTTSKRFYEIDDSAASELAKACRVNWHLPDDAKIGPINTNYLSSSTQPIRLVVVCESPSFAEVEHGYPAYSDTGMKILNRWRSSRKLASVKKKQFSHAQLAANGIYVTNLVRCQADWIPNNDYTQGARLPTRPKDNRVKNAWPLNRDFLAQELRAIASSHKDAPVLFACGSRFKAQIKEAAKLAETAGLNWLASFHPSRLANNLSWHYNRQQWGGRQKTFPSDRKEANRKPPKKADKSDDAD